MFALSDASTVAYALVGDARLAGVNTACRAAIVALTALQRRRCRHARSAVARPAAAARLTTA